MFQSGGKIGLGEEAEEGGPGGYLGFHLKKYLFQLLRHPLRSRRHFLKSRSGKLFLFFAGLNLLFGFAGASGFFAANALLLGSGGQQAMRPAYAVSATCSVALAALFYLLPGRTIHRAWFRGGLLALGAGGAAFWAFMAAAEPSTGFYLALRTYVFGAVLFLHFLFWSEVGGRFSNLESKRYFPLFVVAEILGEALGSLALEAGAELLATRNFFLTFSGLLVLAAASFRYYPAESSAPAPEAEKPEGGSGRRFWGPSSLALAATIFAFWAVYSFVSSGMDLIFNQMALEAFGDGDALSQYLGKVAFFGSLAVLVYQIFFSESLNFRFGVTRTLTALCLLASACLGYFLAFPGMRAAETSQQILYFFTDFAALSLLSSMVNLVPAAQRSRWLAFTEGLGRPLGCYLILAFPVGSDLAGSLEKYRLPLALGAAALALLPLPFAWVYRRHLRRHLVSRDLGLKRNVVEALGEASNWEAVEPLCEAMRETGSVELKDSIVLAIGRIVGHEDWDNLPPGLHQCLLGLEQGLEDIFPRLSVSAAENYVWMQALWAETAASEPDCGAAAFARPMFESLARPLVAGQAFRSRKAAKIAGRSQGS